MVSSHDDITLLYYFFRLCFAVLCCVYYPYKHIFTNPPFALKVDKVSTPSIKCVISINKNMAKLLHSLTTWIFFLIFHSLIMTLKTFPNPLLLPPPSPLPHLDWTHNNIETIMIIIRRERDYMRRDNNSPKNDYTKFNTFRKPLWEDLFVHNSTRSLFCVC